MKNLTNAMLFAKLKSHRQMDRLFAVEELARRKERAGVEPLIAMLAQIESSHDERLSAAGVVMETLAALGDLRAVAPILHVLRLSSGVLDSHLVPVLSARACQALVVLGATSALPALRGLQAGPYGGQYENLIARALVALGGAEEAPFLLELLDLPSTEVRIAALEALGRLQHLPALPAIERFLAAADPRLRLAAVGSLLAMEVPGASARLREEIGRATSAVDRLHVLLMISRHELTGLTRLLLELADDPQWLDYRFDALELAVTLGGGEALTYVRQLSEDVAQGFFVHARTAAILLGAGDSAYLPRCLEILRRASERAPRGGRLSDGARQHPEVLRELVEAVQLHAIRNLEARVVAVDGLLQVARHTMGSPCDEAYRLNEDASRALFYITGAEDDREVKQWRAEYAPGR